MSDSTIYPYDFSFDVKLININGRAQRARAYNQIEKIRTKYERAMRPQLRTVFEMQKQALLKLDTMDVNDVFVAIHSSDTQFRRVFTWMYSTMYKDILPMVERDMERIKSFLSVEKKAEALEMNPKMQDFIRTQAGKKITKIDETTLNAVRDAMDDADNMTEFRNSISSLFDDYTGFRANTIARTETSAAFNAVAIEEVREANYDSSIDKQKEWLGTWDTAIRDTHSMIYGMVVDLDDPFKWENPKYGTIMMDYPLDDSYGAPAAEIINCRCSFGILVK